MINANEGSGTGKAVTVSAKGEIVWAGSNPAFTGAPPTATTHYPGGTAPASGGAAGGDYSSMLGIYGLPPDVQAKVNQIFANTPDVSQATALAMAYVRGTSWYAQTYPGIQTGIAKGVIGNEADYRNYLNQVNILSKQYNGRDISSQEIGDYLAQGYGVTRIGQIYQGAAITNVNKGDWQYATGAFGAGAGNLSGSDATALGQEQAGIDSELGQKLQRRVDLAKQRMQKVFSGTLATPALAQSAGGSLTAPGLGAAKADVAA